MTLDFYGNNTYWGKNFLTLSCLWLSFVAMNGFAFKKKIAIREFWACVSVFVCVVVLMETILLFSSLSIILTIFFLPMYSALLRYTSQKNPIWGEVIEEESTDKSKLEQLIIQNEMLRKTYVSTKQKKHSNVEVILKKSLDLYFVEINESLDKGIKSKKHCFASVVSAVKYIEAKTALKEEDFYASESN